MTRRRASDAGPGRQKGGIRAERARSDKTGGPDGLEKLLQGEGPPLPRRALGLPGRLGAHPRHMPRALALQAPEASVQPPAILLDDDDSEPETRGSGAPLHDPVRLRAASTRGRVRSRSKPPAGSAVAVARKARRQRSSLGKPQLLNGQDIASVYTNAYTKRQVGRLTHSPKSKGRRRRTRQRVGRAVQRVAPEASDDGIVDVDDSASSSGAEGAGAAATAGTGPVLAYPGAPAGEVDERGPATVAPGGPPKTSKRRPASATARTTQPAAAAEGGASVDDSGGIADRGAAPARRVRKRRKRRPASADPRSRVFTTPQSVPEEAVDGDGDGDGAAPAVDVPPDALDLLSTRPRSSGGGTHAFASSPATRPGAAQQGGAKVPASDAQSDAAGDAAPAVDAQGDTRGDASDGKPEITHGFDLKGEVAALRARLHDERATPEERDAVIQELRALQVRVKAFQQRLLAGSAAQSNGAETGDGAATAEVDAVPTPAAAEPLPGTPEGARSSLQGRQRWSASPPRRGRALPDHQDGDGAVLPQDRPRSAAPAPGRRVAHTLTGSPVRHLAQRAARRDASQLSAAATKTARLDALCRELDRRQRRRRVEQAVEKRAELESEFPTYKKMWLRDRARERQIQRIMRRSRRARRSGAAMTDLGPMRDSRSWVERRSGDGGSTGGSDVDGDVPEVDAESHLSGGHVDDSGGGDDVKSEANAGREARAGSGTASTATKVEREEAGDASEAEGDVATASVEPAPPEPRVIDGQIVQWEYDPTSSDVGAISDGGSSTRSAGSGRRKRSGSARGRSRRRRRPSGGGTTPTRRSGNRPSTPTSAVSAKPAVNVGEATLATPPRPRSSRRRRSRSRPSTAGSAATALAGFPDSAGGIAGGVGTRRRRPSNRLIANLPGGLRPSAMKLAPASLLKPLLRGRKTAASPSPQARSSELKSASPPRRGARSVDSDAAGSSDVENNTGGSRRRTKRRTKGKSKRGRRASAGTASTSLSESGSPILVMTQPAHLHADTIADTAAAGDL